MSRNLNPSTNATGIGAAIAALWAAGVMCWHATHGHGVIDPQVIISAVTAAAFLYTRFKVTPVADPKDGAGRPLAPVQFARGGLVPPPGPVVPPPAAPDAGAHP